MGEASRTLPMEIFYLKITKSRDTLCMCVSKCVVYIHFMTVDKRCFFVKAQLSNWKHQANHSPFPHQESQKAREVLYKSWCDHPQGSYSHLWEKHWTTFLFQRKDSSLKIRVCVGEWGKIRALCPIDSEKVKLLHKGDLTLQSEKQSFSMFNSDIIEQ